MIGIDVSYAQGTIDWDSVTGIDFAIIRGGYKYTMDNQFLRNIQACNRLKIPCGIYWFSYAGTAEEARKEAEFCLQTIAPYKVDMFVAFDWEYDSYNRVANRGISITKNLVLNMTNSFLTTINNAGYNGVIYTNIDYLNRYFGGEIASEYPVWCAQWYQVETNPYQFPNTPSQGKSTYAGEQIMWQFGTWKGVPGINGLVDANIFYGELEDDMTIEELITNITPEQAYSLVTKANQYSMNLPAPTWAKEELEQAVQAGITDGKYPMNFIPRYQAALMAYRVKEENE